MPRGSGVGRTLGPMDLAGKRVTVMGLGRFGGGVGVARWLVEQGADVLVTDLEPVERLVDSVAKLRDLVDRGSVTLRLGEHNVSDFTTTDLVVANPAVPKPWENRFLRAAASGGVPITTEIGLAVSRIDRSRVVAVTGSAGKSTTSAMIHRALEGCGREAAFGGNIGGSLLPLIGPGIGGRSREAVRIGAQTFVVLELSSFMLYWLGGGLGSGSGEGRGEASGSVGGGWSPHVAVVTNLSPNHLDWHVGIEHYRRSKRNILASQQAGDIAVLGPGVHDWETAPGVRRILIEARAGVSGLALPGAHNALNAAVALEATCALDPTLERGAAERAIRDFPGLPHRLQLVAQAPATAKAAGARFFNDSKSTTPESTLLAVDSVRDAARGLSHVHLIAGGYDKGSDLTPVAALARELGGLYTIGATGPAIAAGAGGLPPDRVFECRTLAAAFERACSRLSPGGVLLLSPACASWDQYENFERPTKDEKNTQ